MAQLKGYFSDAEFKVSQGKRWLFIQSSGTAEEPSGVVYQSTDGTTHTKRYTWFDQDGNFRMKDDTAPTDEDAQGSVLFGTSTAGANITLSNLGTVAMATHLLNATDSTYNLGGSNYWANAYIDKIYVGAAETIDGGTGNKILFEATTSIEFGVDDDGVDIVFHGASAGSNMTWDESGDTLVLTDDSAISFGDALDFTVEWNAAALVMDNKTSDTGAVIVGSVVVTDFELHGSGADLDVGWDASADTFQLCDGVTLNIGGAALNTMDGFSFKYVVADSAMYVEAIAENDTIEWGKTNQMDWLIHGNSASNDITWDASANTWSFLDSTILAFGTGDDFQISCDGTLLNIVHAVGTTGGIVITPLAATTVAAVHIDGATNDWDGADDVGMLHISSDTTLADAGATLFYVENSGTKVLDSSEGFLARFVDTATVSDTPPAYAVQISSTNNFGLNVVTGVATASNLVMSGLQAQTVAIADIDGTTGTGWDGADDVGMLTIKSLIQNHTGATSLLVETEVAPIAQAEGACARFIQTGGAAVTDGYLVQIEATTLGGALHVDTGFVTFDEALTVGGTLTQTGAATFTAGSQNSAVAIAPNAGGDGTAIIAAGTSFCSVTSTNTAHILTLPVPVLGNTIIFETTDTVHFELGVQATTQYINGTLCNGGETLEIIDTATFMAVCSLGGASGKWLITSITNAGVVTDGATPD